MQIKEEPNSAQTNPSKSSPFTFQKFETLIESFVLNNTGGPNFQSEILEQNTDNPFIQKHDKKCLLLQYYGKKKNAL
jgi:hypothetical protein